MSSIQLRRVYCGCGSRRLLAVAVLGATLVSLGACGQDASKTGGTPPPPAVEVTEARLQDLASERLFTGRIEAIDKVNIRARVQGFIKSRNFEEGREVKKGDLLYEIEPEPFRFALDQAQANLESAKGALTLAQQTFARAEDLAGRGAGSIATLDQARSALVQAQSTLRAREADVQTATLNLGYTRIVAPMDGKVGRSAFSVGNLVGIDSGTLVTLVAQDPMFVTFPVPQWLLLQVRKAGEGSDSVVVKLKLADGSIYDEVGQIEFTDVQAMSATDSVLVRAKIPNPQRLLTDQQLVNVLAVRKQPEKKLVISQSALMLDQQGAYVLVVDKDSKVELKRIRIGEQRGTNIIVESGLAAGERTIVSGQQKVRPGLVVTAHAAAQADVVGTQVPAVASPAAKGEAQAAPGTAPPAGPQAAPKAPPSSAAPEAPKSTAGGN